MCVWSVCVGEKWTETDRGREGDRFRLQAALKSVYSLRWALRGQPYSSPSLLLHYSGSGHTLFSSSSLSPQGPIEPLTNTLTYLNSLTDPLPVSLSVCLSLLVSLDLCLFTSPLCSCNSLFNLFLFFWPVTFLYHCMTALLLLLLIISFLKWHPSLSYGLYSSLWDINNCKKCKPALVNFVTWGAAAIHSPTLSFIWSCASFYNYKNKTNICSFSSVFGLCLLLRITSGCCLVLNRYGTADFLSFFPLILLKPNI